MRVKLPYGKRGQVIDLGDHDKDDSLTAGFIGYVMGKNATFDKKAGKTAGKPHRRGPVFSRVDRLIE